MSAAGAGAGAIVATKINDATIKPLKLAGGSKLPVKGADLFAMAFFSAFLCAQTNSGKTWVIATILMACCTPDTKIVVFCPTVGVDDAWIAIEAWCKKTKRPFIHFPALKNKNGVDMLDLLLEKIKAEKKDSKEQEQAEPQAGRYVGMAGGGDLYVKETGSKAAKEPKEPTPKYEPIDYIFVFDDLSDTMRHSHALTALAKTARHYKSKVLISSQWVSDLDPAARRQIAYWLLFNGMNVKNLDTVYQSIAPKFDEKLLKRYYDAGTEIKEDRGKEGKFPFLYISKTPWELRWKFTDVLTEPSKAPAKQVGGARPKTKPARGGRSRLARLLLRTFSARS